jgi:quinoprotein glucose dehydrogenase
LGWKIKGGTADGIQYSQLDRINRENVNQLQVAWRFRSGDADTINNRTQIQCNPIVVGNVLYGTTPALKAFALEANSGKLLWKFEPGEANTGTWCKSWSDVLGRG